MSLLRPLSSPHRSQCQGNTLLAALMMALIALSAPACSDDGPAVKDEEDSGPVDTGVSDAGPDDSSVSEDDGSAPEDVPDSAGSTDEEDVGEAVDAGAVDIGVSDKCSSNQYCLTKLKGQLSKCETAICDLGSGLCAKQKKLGTCCNDADCKDDNECTLKETCDLQSNTCNYEVKPDCCPGAGKNVNFVDEKFEQGAKLPVGWTAKTTLKDSNVTWHISTNRSRNGKRSLYLGNDCKTYDTGMTEQNGCKAGNGKTFKAQVSSAEAVIPAKTDAIAHFWLWLDSEPLYTKTDKKKTKALTPSNDCKAKTCAEKGKCTGTGPCCFGETCVKFPDNGPTECLAERDALKLYVQVKGQKYAVWDSSCINKTTGGKWVHQVVHLAPYLKSSAGAGAAVKLIWEFDTGSGTFNDYEGVYIDDLKVETLCTGKEGYPTCSGSSPCSTKAEDKGLCGDPGCTTSLNGDLGLCFYDKAPGCCDSKDKLACDDGNSCTIDSCKQADATKAGMCQNVPDSSNPQCCQPSNTFKETFETGTVANWDVECNSKSVIWHATKNQKKGGEYGMCFGTTDGKGYDDPSLKPKGPKCTVCSKKLKIHAGTVFNVLKFAVKMKTEWTGAKEYLNPHPKNPALLLDRLRVFTKDAGNEVDLWTSDQIKGSTSNGGADWEVQISDKLDQFAGKEKTVCIQFDTGDAGANTGGHVCVDDLSLDVTCKPFQCVNDKGCTSGGPCTVGTCQADNTCSYEKQKNCCLSEKDCNDNNSCTEDKCSTEGKCVFTLPKDKADCCSPATPKDNGAVLDENFEKVKDPKAGPQGWSLKTKTGQPGTTGSYSKDIMWSVSTLKSKPGTGAFSLYFGKNGTYNAGTAVPAGTADSPVFALQGSSKAHHFVSFDLFLDTEWTKPVAGFKKYPIGGGKYLVIDQFRVWAIDTEKKDAKWMTVFDSYDIEGSTFGKWRTITAKLPKELSGKKIRLRFDFDAGSGTKNAYEGVYVDNLTLQTTCAAPACGSVADCAKSDACQRYYCSVDAKTGAPACATEFKPGPSCCAPTLSLPLETVEGGKFDSWEVPTPSIGDVQWHIAKKNKPGMPTYLSGNAEIRYGSKSKPHYLTGSGAKCAVDTDCKTSGEFCAKNAKGVKGCYLPVKGALRSKVISPDADPKKGLIFKFKAYIDIEPGTFETLNLVAMDETAQNQLGGILWSKKNLKSSDYKKVIDVQVDLDAINKSGAKFRLEFRFDSGDPKQNDKFYGIHLDDLAVEKTCKK